jgi:hypothetical protein
MASKSSSSKITATGTRGYLLWLATDPAFAVIYNKIQPQLKQLQSQLNATPATPNNPLGMCGFGRIGELGGFGDFGCCCVGLSDSDVANINAGSSVSASDFNAVNAVTPTIQVNPAAAVAASPAATTPSLAASLSSIVGVAAQGVLTADQISTANQINQIQISRAQAGLPPLNLSTGALGLPQATVSLLGSTAAMPLLLLGGGLILLLVLMGDHKSV